MHNYTGNVRECDVIASDIDCTQNDNGHGLVKNMRSYGSETLVRFKTYRFTILVHFNKYLNNLM